MTCKSFILALLFLSPGAALAQDQVIISDLDETLRIANVEKSAKAGMKLAGGIKPYEGLTAIFQDLKLKNPTAKFYYLSNSFTFLYDGVRWVKKHKLPEGVVFQRSTGDRSLTYKAEKLREIRALHPSASIMMFGDNIERDPVFYKNFKEESQLADAKIYIRDARLIFPEDKDIFYFQTELQLASELDLAPETRSFINGLSFSKLVPTFLLSNLKKRIIKDCKHTATRCSSVAEKKVQEVVEQLTPSEASELVEDSN